MTGARGPGAPDAGDSRTGAPATWPAWADRLPPALALAVAAARTRLSDARLAQLRALCSGPVDWDAAIGEARRHGVDPLLHRHLRAIGAPDVPEAVLARLRAHAETTAVRNRLLGAELGKVLARLEAHGVAAIPYKGPVLAALVYGDIGARRFADLDVLVRRGDVPRAKAALGELGYAPRLRLTPGQERAYLDAQCEYAFDRDRGRLTVEIHWDVVPPDFAVRLDLDRLWAAARTARVGDAAVRVPAPDDLLLVLIVHGTKHLWERLGWLVDVAEAIDAHPALDWPALLTRARGRGVARMVRLALHLAAELLDAAVPDAVRCEAAGDRAVAALAPRVADWLAGAPPGPRSIQGFRAHLTLRERPRDRAALLLRSALTPTVEDWASVRLPAALLPAHYLLRPLRLARKHAARVRGSGRR
jgi:hypothetical protein